MAAASDKRVLMPSDMLYFLTFALGMLGFWSSGKAGLLVSSVGHIHNSAVSMGATVTVFGLGMAILAFIVTRSLKGTLAATFIAAALGLVTAQLIIRIAGGHITNQQQVGMLTFVLYFCYGFIYVAALAAGRRIAKPRA